MSDAAERILEYIHSGAYGPEIDAALIVLRDGMLAGMAAGAALSAAAAGPASRLDLPLEEVASDLEVSFEEAAGAGLEEYALACQRERDMELVEYALSSARKGGPRPPKDWSTGSLNWNFQDPARESFDPRYVLEIEAVNPAWMVTAEERDAFKYESGGYARVEGRSADDLKAELEAVYEEHYAHRDDFGFDGMVRLFAEDDFYNHHYVARRYIMARFEHEAVAPLPGC